MPPKRFWKKKHKAHKHTKNFQRKQHDKYRDDRASARLAVEDMTVRQTISPPLEHVDVLEAPKIGQGPTRSPPRDGTSWHDPFDFYLYPPTSLNFQPPFDRDGSHLARRSPGLTEYEGKSVEILAPIMAPGHDQQQQRNQPPHHRPHPQPGSVQQKVSDNPKDIAVNGEHQQRSQNARERDTERDTPQRKSTAVSSEQKPLSNHIQVAKPYVFQQAIEGCLKDVGVAQAREDNIRLAGVQWIDNVRRALKLPVRTFDTAVVYYHKFRLVHSDGEYSFVDAAAASLFAACKIEDTLKKSRDILCAAHNLKVPRNEHLSPDDAAFEQHSRSIIGLERLMLEASSFDFRNRHPQTLMIKLAKNYNLGSPRTSNITKTAYAISLDLYRTFAPLKQSTATLAFTCLELAIRLHDQTTSSDPGITSIITGTDYTRWGISRAEVMETLLDLLELYTHYRTSTTAGADFPLDTFLEVRIPLNEELNSANLPRFTEHIDIARGTDPAGYAATVNGVTATNTTANGTPTPGDKSPTSPSSLSGKANGIRQKAGERGRDGTVRFMLNPDRERQERLVVAEYHPNLHASGPASGPEAGSGPGSGQGQTQTSGRGPPHTPNQPASQQPPSQPQSHYGPSRRGGGPPMGNERGHGYGHGHGHGPGPGPGMGRGHGHSHHPRGQGYRRGSLDRGGMESKPPRR